MPFDFISLKKKFCLLLTVPASGEERWGNKSHVKRTYFCLYPGYLLNVSIDDSMWWKEGGGCTGRQKEGGVSERTNH